MHSPNHGFYRFPLLLLLLVFLTGCAALGDATRSESLFRHPRFHTVQQGDTLYSISWRYGYQHQIVAKWNNIPPPYIINKGQRIRVAPPPGWYDEEQQKPPIQKAEKKQRSKRQSSTGKPRYVRTLRWQWPVEKSASKGQINAVNKGIEIVGNEGQAIYAAAGGKVVYSGSGLRGYGKLIIVKHDDVYLSAYAHNKDILVKEGETVSRGKQIARMGDSGTDRVKLYFEIRRDGRPINPLKYLPKTP